MKITILGSGAWNGIPAPFCNCRVCSSGKKESSKDYRTRPEILVETDKGSFLIEIGPDIRLQSARFKLKPITDFLVTHWHFDHLYGILELHAWFKYSVKKTPRIFCSTKTKEWMDKAFGHIPKEVVVLEPFKSFELYGVKITPIPVYHMKYCDDSLSESQLENTFGYILEHKGKKVTYLADYYSVPEKSKDFALNSDVLIADGTYIFENLFPNKPEQINLKSDPDHYHDKEIFNFASELKPKKTVLFSISHLSEKKHSELVKLVPKNVEVSFDGMKLKL